MLEDMLCTSKVLQEGTGGMDCLGDQDWLDKKERREIL